MLGRLWRFLPFVASSQAYAPLLEGSKNVTAPKLFFASPAQLWIGPLISKVNKAGTLEEDWLPKLNQSAARLRVVFNALKREDGGFVPFLLQFEIGGMLLIGALLEIASCASTLGAPLVLHKLLQAPDNIPLAWMLVVVTILATVCGRAKDEVCRVQSAWIECMLRSAIFDKSLRLSPASRLVHPPAKIINITAVDVGFLTNYVLKIHDVWSSPIQIVGIAILTASVMGWTGLIGFGLVIVIFMSQTRLGKRIGKSVGGYIRNNDMRLGTLRDMLNNIKSVKAGAVEDVFCSKIIIFRNEQLKSLRYYLTASFAMFTAVNQTTPYLAACAAFLAYAMSGERLTSDIVFPCLAYFHLLYQPVTLASLAMARQFSMRPSLKRVQDLLNAKESQIVSSDSTDDVSGPAVSFKSANFEWPAENESETTTHLEINNLDIPRDKLTTIIGANGSGKSSLFEAILGEMVLVSGSCHTNGSVAYCAQEPWIMSGTLRDNIVFNSTKGYNAERYRQVICACELDTDFDKLPGGAEFATVGESGSNLSGGQRARVSLARALYSDAEILLLDDPLAALDSRVRGQLFGSIRKLGKTVILVTLHTSYASQSDHIVVMEDNKLLWEGSRSNFFLQGWIAKYIHDQVEDTLRTTDVKAKQQSESALTNEDNNKQATEIEDLLQEEERAQGAVQWDVANFYIHLSGGMGYAAAVLIMTCFLTASKVISQYWFVWWIADAIGLNQEQYMGSYLGLTITQGVVTAAVGLMLVSSSMKATRKLHDTILDNLISAPLWFFQQNPTGRILNRLSRDVEAMDINIMNAIDGLIAAGTTMIASVAIVASSGIFLVGAVLPFLIVVGWCLQLFRVTAREIQRLDSVLQSPALSVMTESLRAPSSVRAYNAVPFLVTRHGQALDRLAAAKISRSSLDTWITFRAELAAAFVLLVLTQLTVNGFISHESASLALGTATTLARNVYLLAWAATDLEIQLNAVERLQTYHDDIPKEGNQLLLDENSISEDESWPKFNSVDITRAYLKYKTRKTAALETITLKISQGQKVGVVGRTGSGKSTLISAISRLVDIQSGSITIGGVNTAKVAPRRLRRNVITLPQETLLFQGTLRENVDPYGRHTDTNIWGVLEACQMRGFFHNKYGETALDQELSTDGADLSGGQRQLVCAARVLLERPAILLVDEASANVDFASDEALQRAWQSLPAETTMITIAHRASSLAWMDRVIVMENGKIVEDGSPRELLAKATESSYYRTSIEQDGSGALEKALEMAIQWDEMRRT